MFRKKFDPDSLYFSADPHIQHKNLCRGVSEWDKSRNGTRDFDTIKEMDDAVIDSYNQVPADATFFVLGDFLFGNKNKLPEVLDRIRCKNIVYLYGNHSLWLRERLDFHHLFIGLYDYLEIFAGHQLLCMFHYSAAVWNESHKNSYFLSGHSHGTYKPALPESNEGKILDVGWDVHKKPISFWEIDEIMKKKKAHKVDHHNEKTT